MKYPPEANDARRKFFCGFFYDKENDAMAETTTEATLIPIDEAARRLGTTPLNVFMHIKRKLLTACEIEEAWFVDSDSLAAFIANHAGPDRTLCRSHCSKGGGCSSGCG